ncbi:MAG: TlpA family protein disulfide reductase [Deltaproteobacteria bacterium]|nr:TlpA family protein disulfide reductase [Deltaproteobacteria bacterium]
MSEKSMGKDLWRLAPWLGAAVGLSAILAVGAMPACHSEAPDFTAPLVSGPDVGDRVSLTALRGEIVVIDFWASWCGPCRRSIPVLNRLAADYDGRVHVYGINVEAMEPMAVGSAHQRLGATFPSLHDPSGSIQRAYAVTALPTLFVIDREGQIWHTERGIPALDDLSQVLDELLSANTQAR